MRKILSLAFILLLLLSCFSINAFAAQGGKNMGSVPIASGIVIDGIKDSLYDQGVVIAVDKVVALDATHRGTAWLLWDGAENLYVYAEVKGKLTPIDPADQKPYPEAMCWLLDSFEVFLDVGNEGTDSSTSSQYRIDAAGCPSYDWRNEWNGLQVGADIVGDYFGYGHKYIDGGYAVEFKIPVEGIKAGMVIGLEFNINDMSVSEDARAMVTANANDGWNVGEYGYITIGANEVVIAEEIVETEELPEVSVTDSANPAVPVIPQTGESSFIWVILAVLLPLIFAIAKKKGFQTR